jgi:hypothetical protein
MRRSGSEIWGSRGRERRADLKAGQYRRTKGRPASEGGSLSRLRQAIFNRKFRGAVEVEILRLSLSDSLKDDKFYFFGSGRSAIKDISRPEVGPWRRWLKSKLEWQAVQRSLT